VVLLVYVLTTPAPTSKEDTQEYENIFQHGKEVLSLLLGVFGAIVGFYFGSEVSKAGEDKSLKIAPLRLTGVPAVSGKAIVVNTVVSGGKPPWRYAIVIGEGLADPLENVEAGGWIVKEVSVPSTDKETSMAVRVVVRDEDNQMREQRIGIKITPEKV
jgi:hypothetical protein